MIDADNAIVEIYDERTVWMMIATAGFTDGEYQMLDRHVFEVTGTRTYPTALGGSKTVLVLKALDSAAVQRRVDEARAREDAKLWRTWTAASGGFTVDAKLLDFKSGNAKLQKRDGSIIDVSPAKLSNDDQKYIREEIARWKTEGKPSAGVPSRQVATNP